MEVNLCMRSLALRPSAKTSLVPRAFPFEIIWRGEVEWETFIFPTLYSPLSGVNKINRTGSLCFIIIRLARFFFVKNCHFCGR